MNINKPLRINKSGLIKKWEEEEGSLWWFYIASESSTLEEFMLELGENELDEITLELIHIYFKLFKPNEICCFFVNGHETVDINYEFSKPYKFICTIDNGDDAVIIFSNEKFK